MNDLSSAQLEALAALLKPPASEDARVPHLVALMPCEPAVGEVAVACWSSGEEDAEIEFELVRMDDGRRLDDAVAMREALTLLAMVETMEELASFNELVHVAAELRTWRGDGQALPEAFSRARASALEAIDAVLALTPDDDTPRTARPALLDELGGALRELQRAWELLEQAAELWSDSLLAARANDAAALEVVQELWRMLGAVRRSALAQPPSSALHAGREAGVAMAAAIRGAGAGAARSSAGDAESGTSTAIVGD